ncbi:hypothetical protein STEG23_020997 [Scotinomys teguina]
MAGTFQEKALFIFSDTDRALLTQAPEDTSTHCLIISSRKGKRVGLKSNTMYCSCRGPEFVFQHPSQTVHNCLLASLPIRRHALDSSSSSHCPAFLAIVK